MGGMKAVFVSAACFSNGPKYSSQTEGKHRCASKKLYAAAPAFSGGIALIVEANVLASMDARKSISWQLIVLEPFLFATIYMK
jgi:hypothetical protein